MVTQSTRSESCEKSLDAYIEAVHFCRLIRSVLETRRHRVADFRSADESGGPIRSTPRLCYLPPGVAEHRLSNARLRTLSEHLAEDGARWPNCPGVTGNLNTVFPIDAFREPTGI
jgi:hypothetical protein